MVTILKLLRLVNVRHTIVRVLLRNVIERVLSVFEMCRLVHRRVYLRSRILCEVVSMKPVVAVKQLLQRKSYIIEGSDVKR